MRRHNVKIALDVGANVGQYRNFLRNYVGFGGLIVSFEPVAALAASLKQCAASDPSWLVFDIALGAQDGIAEFNVMKTTVFSSFRQPSHDHLIDEGNVIDHVEQVQVRRLDSVLGEIDADAKSDFFLKLDTQGHDLEVIKGISSFDRIRLIQSEMSLIPIYKEMPSMADSIRIFQELGFGIAALCPEHTDDQHRKLCYKLTTQINRFREFSVPAIEPFKPRIVSSTVDARARPKDFLTPEEVERLVAATKGSRYPLRDRAMLLVMYHHGLRVSELISSRNADVDLNTSRLWIRRAKGGLDTEHPIMGAELRAIKRYLATRKDSLPWLFVSERGAQFARMSVYKIVQHTAERAGLPNVHPHTLRHSCGLYLANKGCDLRLIGDYLGHRSVQSAMRYTRTAASRFEGLWR